MMKMKINKMKLENFKGVKNLELNFSDLTEIKGDNGTGKTTIVDAFLWCLFGKNSLGQSNFDIKPLDENGNAASGIECSVELELKINDRTEVIKKTFCEIWTKKRGDLEKTFSGNENVFHINEVPSKEKEFKEFVNNILDENKFKMITNPIHFNSLKWQDKRAIIIEVCGDVTDEEVLSGNTDLSELFDKLNGRSVEDYKKIIKEQLTKTNKELESLPVRIDEVNKGIVEIEISETDLNSEKEKLEKELELLNEEKNSSDKGAIISQKNISIKELELKIKELESERNENIRAKGRRKLEIESEMSQDKNSNIKKSLNIIAEFELELKNINSELESTHKNKELKNEFIEEQEVSLKNMRVDYVETKKTEYIKLEFKKENCSSCGQSLPEEKNEELLEKFNLNENNKLEKFNSDKAEKLEKLGNKGKDLSSLIDKNKVEVQKLEKRILELELLRENTLFAKDETTKELEKMRVIEIDFNSNEEYRILSEVETCDVDLEIQNIKNEIQNINIEIDNLKTGAENKEIFIKIDEVKIKINEVVKNLNLYQNNKTAAVRLKELDEERAAKNKVFTELTRVQWLLEQFTKKKVEFLEDKINSKFKYAKFKLFNTLVNGGIEECCETTFQGVPFTTNLNNGARINVGLDIINTLSEFYNAEMPIFIDNCESVTKLIETNTQLIKLIVDEKYKKMEVL